jgi:hypothetical protein
MACEYQQLSFPLEQKPCLIIIDQPIPDGHRRDKSPVNLPHNASLEDVVDLLTMLSNNGASDVFIDSASILNIHRGIRR